MFHCFLMLYNQGPSHSKLPDPIHEPWWHGTNCGLSSQWGGGRVARWCWVNFQCRGVLLIWYRVGQGPTALAEGAGGGCLDIFSLIFHFSFLSPYLWETARYRLKYCLKGPLRPNQPTNQILHSGFNTDSHELNPLYTSGSGLLHWYMLVKSICHFRGIWAILSLLFYFWWKILLTNNVDPDQMPHLCGICTVCQSTPFRGSSLQRVNSLDYDWDILTCRQSWPRNNKLYLTKAVVQLDDISMQIINHIRMIEGWSWKEEYNGTPFKIEKISASGNWSLGL